jgi:hypothetical protein
MRVERAALLAGEKPKAWVGALFLLFWERTMLVTRRVEGSAAT